jgi:hypothetical protein
MPKVKAAADLMSGEGLFHIDGTFCVSLVFLKAGNLHFILHWTPAS